MKSVRRSIAGLAAAALTAAGLSVLGLAHAPAAHAEEVAVDDAVLRWGVSTEVNSAAFAPGTWNLMSAGLVGNPGAGGQTLTSANDGATWSNASAAGWSNQAGNVTVEDLQSGGDYAPTTFLGTRQNSAGVNGTTGNGVDAETQLVFRNGTGTVDVAANTASIQWDGDATILFYSGMTFFYLSDPELTVAPDGSGEVTATVDGYASAMDDPTQWTDLDAEEVTLATLTGVDVEDLGFTTTPDYLGVTYDAPEGATPQSQTGVSWGAFPQDFVDFQQLTGGSSYWYSSGGAADARKPTLPLEVSYDLTPADPEVTVSETTLSADGSHEVTVTGTGFDPALATGTRPPLAGKPSGTYVVFGKFAADWQPSAAAPSSSRRNSSQKWAVLAEDMATIGGPAAGAVELHPDGSFEATVTVSKAAVDAIATDPSLVNYGIYTYPGGGATQPLYETYTPITFTTVASTLTASVLTTPTTTKTGSARLAVAPSSETVATGDVSAQVRDARGAVVATLPGTLDDSGATTVILPRLSPGKHTIEGSYAGDGFVSASSATTSFTVAKVAPVWRRGWTRVPTAVRAGGIRFRVNGAGVGAGTGTVTVQVKNAAGKVVKTVRVRLDATGLAKVPVPKLKAGKYALVASYAGDASIKTGRYVVRFTAARR